MPNSKGWVPVAERAVLGVLLLWLLWLPLPFGSNVELARAPLVVTPLALCALAALLRLIGTRERERAPESSRAWKIWSAGGALLLGVVALQLLPLPAAVLRAVSPESHAIWGSAMQVVNAAGLPVATMHPVSVDPGATRWELFRLAGLLAAFQAAVLLVRSPRARVALAATLSLSATLQILYGARELALGRYAIWGWVNRLVFSRVTGTFVNPNHFAHYVAIIFPMALFLAACVWREATPPKAPLRIRVVRLFEHGIVRFTIPLLVALGFIAAVLLAQSRGGLLALGGGLFITAAMLPGRKIARIAFASAAGAIIVAALVLLLGHDRTGRMGSQEDVESSLGGRRVAMTIAMRLWSRFAVAGSGAGTFGSVAELEHTERLDRTYHRAHNDYLEFGATTGTIGFMIVFVSLAGGYVALIRQTFGREAAELRWVRRAFQAAALASLSIALVHALFDFNFYIPANPATLAVILGAAVSSLDHDLRARR